MGESCASAPIQGKTRREAYGVTLTGLAGGTLQSKVGMLWLNGRLVPPEPLLLTRQEKNSGPRICQHQKIILNDEDLRIL